MPEQPPKPLGTRWQQRGYGDVVTLKHWVFNTRSWIVQTAGGSDDLVNDEVLERDYTMLGDDDVDDDFEGGDDADGD